MAQVVNFNKNITPEPEGFKLFRINVVNHPVLKLEEKYDFRLNYYTILHSFVNTCCTDRIYASKLLDCYRLNFSITDDDIKNLSDINRNEALIKNAVKKITGNRYIFKWFPLKLDIINYKYLLFSDIYYFFNNDMEITKGSILDNFIRTINVKRNDAIRIRNFFMSMARGNFEEADKLISHKKFSHLRYFYDRAYSEKVLCNKEPFNIVITATMSAGKSTFLNALVGRDFFPARNEACTAKIFKLTDNNYMFMDRYIGYALNEKNIVSQECVMDKQILANWNSNSDIHFIYVEGDLLNLSSESFRINLFDTPGTNSSLNKNHSKITKKFIEQGDIKIILFVLNATTLLTDDDSYLFERILKLIETDTEVIFLLNKIDEFDLEQEDSIEEAMASISSFLKKFDILKPVIIPISSYAAKIFKSVLDNKELTKKERKDFLYLYKLFSKEKYNLNPYSTYNGNIINENSLNNLKEDYEIKINDQSFSARSVFSALNYTGILQVEKIINNLTGAN